MTESNNGNVALIKHQDNSEQKIYLNLNTMIEKEHYILEVKDSKIRFAYSDCKDQICVKTGFINGHGQMAVCLPNKTSITILE